MTDPLLTTAYAAYGWGPQVTVTPGPRGALGRIWRVRAPAGQYALKHSFDAPPDGRLAAELDLTRRAADAGVRVPATHPAADGRLLVPAPGGGVLRLYDWVDLHPIDPDAPSTPQRLGELLARLHSCAPPAFGGPSVRPPGSSVQAGGEEAWYHEAPDAAEFAAFGGRPWSDRLARLAEDLPQLTGALAPPDPAALRLCHRDLHPENVQTGPDGDLVVLDWDQVGPAEPARELIQTLYAWFTTTSDAAAEDRMPACYAAYVDAGGPGRIRGPADYTMLLADRLNFLLHQARIAADPGTADDDRAWAEREIDETLRLLPTPRQLSVTAARIARTLPAAPGSPPDGPNRARPGRR
ncbi:Ser/Thr protein kinase RdoA (MazF antagonist) [Hamadaea flava]|uniref:Phosphotransferase enzyme family protein n=1 Tax=Hamadaea flava TaxID=1742688 RepID=A0ABV8LRX9_9ACTN|nr:phosphotransferase [Hamadaea flava]MCP2321770.1 Ser/Thr protein kinase RdoA (MazF antagonist) [Hamadaea flava]